jgi:flagellar basal-body rod protein FlgB|tara:strand:- start:2633 stop:3025 length:393 start_codon:yes stop_codon:yes gene_type:complete
MAISFDSALGLHPGALALKARRAEILANNIINSDTPGFKSRDFDFHSLLLGMTQKHLDLKQTHPQHAGGSAAGPDGDLHYRVPLQPAIDGNTVDAQFEQAAFTRNALQFQTTMTFLNGRFRGLMAAIRGE